MFPKGLLCVVNIAAFKLSWWQEEDSAYRVFEVLIHCHQVYTDEFCTLDPTPEKMSPKKHTFRDPRLVGKALTSRRPALSRQD